MIKKRYLILSVAVISVILASLFYSNITQAEKGKKPTEEQFKDSVSISLKSSRISTETSPHINATLPFTFNPKGQNFNVTRMWISFIISGNFWHSIDFTLNGATTISLNYFVSSDTITSFETDASFYGTIVEGINVFTVSEIYRDSVTPITEQISYMTLFIEYEYQAR